MQVEAYGLADGGAPLFFEVHEQLLPTVYALWRAPHMLPQLHTYSEVSPKVGPRIMVMHLTERYSSATQCGDPCKHCGTAALPPCSRSFCGDIVTDLTITQPWFQSGVAVAFHSLYASGICQNTSLRSTNSKLVLGRSVTAGGRRRHMEAFTAPCTGSPELPRLPRRRCWAAQTCFCRA